MGDANMSVEQGDGKIVIAETPKQEVLLKPGKVDLEAFYQKELTRYRAKNAVPHQRSWGIIEKVAANRIDSPYQLSYEQMSYEQPAFSSFAPESIRKIDILSSALNIRVDKRTIGELQTIIENPDYLDFAASLVQQNPSVDRKDIPVFDNIIALDKAGLLKPLANLYRSGIVLAADRYGRYEYEKSLGTLFDGYVADYKETSSSPQAPEQAIEYLRNLLKKQEVQDILQDPQKQEFFGLVTDITGYPVSIGQIDSSLISPNFFNGSREAIYLLKLTENYGEKGHSVYLQTVSGIVEYKDREGHHFAKILERLTDQDFPVFLQTLREKTGHEFLSGHFDLSYQLSELTKVFNALKERKDLIGPICDLIIKTNDPEQLLNTPRLLKQYMQLASNPNMVKTISVLSGIGLEPSTFGTYEADILQSISKDSNSLNKLSSKELRSFSQRLAEEFGWQATIHQVKSLIELFDDTQFQNQLFSQETADFVKKVIPTEPQRIILTQIKDMLSLGAPSRILLTQLAEQFNYTYNPSLYEHYVKLDAIPEAIKKIKEALSQITPKDLLQEQNFKLFVLLGADAPFYNHAKKLVSDDYFINIRDATIRLNDFMESIDIMPHGVIAKAFTLSQKATELDRLALKLVINATIAKATNRENWYGSLLEASNFQEADEVLRRLMIELSLPVVYSDLQGEGLVRKQSELVELAKRDKEFEDILEICCRSVGIYGKKYPNKGAEFATLMGAIRDSLDLNLERNPRAYLERRRELSAHQFDRIFEEFPQDVREKVLQMWLDLSSRRSLRVSESVVVSEEATLSRLNRIRDIVQIDLSIHLKDLFLAKIKELEQKTERGETDRVEAEQLAIYKQYLLTPEGEVKQDIPHMYRSVKTFVRSARLALRNPVTPREEKVNLGKNLGVYQTIAESLRTLYRLGTISEERYKARRDYLNEINKNIGQLGSALKKLRILDPDRRSKDVNINALEGEVLLNFEQLGSVMAQERISEQFVFDIKSTVDFVSLARAPEMTESCQRLTEVTNYNQAAYSRLVDGVNEMIDVYTLINGEKKELARSFIELSKVKVAGEEHPRLAILIDREYVNHQYQDFTNTFAQEMIAHMLDRIGTVPELSLIFDTDTFFANPKVKELLKTRRYRVRQVSGEYFINESNVKLEKYYDSLWGLTNVAQPSYKSFRNFYLIEKS